MWFIVGVGFVVEPRSLLAVINCCGELIVSSSLLGPVLLLGRGHCFCCLIVGASSVLCRFHCCGRFRSCAEVIVGALSLFGRVNFCMGFIVGVGFIVGTGHFWW